MNIEQAPTEYIKEYYEQRILRRREFTEATEFYLTELKRVRGKRVLNAGCGPQLYDYLRYFGELPVSYYGLDINNNTFDYLKYSRNRELLNAKRFARDHGVDVHYVAGDLIDCMTETEPFDCIVGVGFLGTFGKTMFQRVMDSVNDGLSESGLLINISWYDNHLSKNVHRKKVKYRFDRIDGPTPDDAVDWTEQQGFHLIHRAIFDVPDKPAYGWGKIQSCVFEKST